MKKWIALCAILPFVFLSSCGSDDDSPPTGGGPTDTTPPGITSVTAVDANHLTVVFDEPVTRQSAERPSNYLIRETNATPAPMGKSAPGDTIHIDSAALDDDDMTVNLSTQNSMGNLPYQISITGVEDPSGNKINTPAQADFTGSDASDTTPPVLLSQTPAPGAFNVGIGQSVILQFSERMDYGSVQQAFHWTWTGGTVAWDLQEESGNHFVFTPLSVLLNNTTYSVQLDGTAQDWAGNGLMGGTTMWTFTTTASQDNNPPNLVSSTPANGATNVSVATNLVMNFSEPIDRASLMDVFINPDPGNGQVTWSNGDRTVTFDPDVDLMDDTQYTLVIFPGGVRDLAGNGNVGPIQIVWSTGSTLNSGSIEGTIAGDPGSPVASNPAGATVIAADRNPFGGDDNFGIGGSAAVGGGGSYKISNLADDWYYPIAAMETNGDSQIDPGLGDAIGIYGGTLPFDIVPDSVEINGGNTVSNVDFALFDPMAIAGTVDAADPINGFHAYFVGAYDTTGLDLGNLPEPDFITEGFWPFDPNYSIDELEEGMEPGTYYIGAYVDVNDNFVFDPAVDPFGMYGGATPTPVTLGDSEDALGVDILVADPIGLGRGNPVQWRITSSGALPPETLDWIRRILAGQR